MTLIAKAITKGIYLFAFMIYLSLKTVRMKNLHNYEMKLFKLGYFSIHRHILCLCHSFKKSFFRVVEFDGKTEITVCSL